MTTVTSVPAVLKDVDDKMKKAQEVMARDFGAIRTGRASTALLEGVKVDGYGSQMPLKQLASISTPDAKLIVVQPWDAGLLTAIEKAIRAAELGVNPVIDKKIIRVPIPPLSTERREEFVKLAHRQAETCRVSVRNARHGAREAIEKLFKDKTIAEDDKFKAQDDLEKLTQKAIAQTDTLLKAKEAEIRAV
ncbi:MAG: ribosome recycling factor [Candidatus Omnitrophica bacterium]|nr:ribosome recycling factor [Candidatus Omnitrophota bacterium]